MKRAYIEMKVGVYIIVSEQVLARLLEDDVYSGEDDAELWRDLATGCVAQHVEVLNGPDKNDPYNWVELDAEVLHEYDLEEGPEELGDA